MESELSVLIIFTFEEQSCLILDSIFQSCFHNSESGFQLQILILGLPDFLWIEPNEHNWTELNKYNKREFTKMRTKLTTTLCKYIVNTVTLWLVIAVAKLSKVMQASPWKTIIKNQQWKPLTPSVKLNQLIQSLIILNAENKIGHLT